MTKKIERLTPSSQTGAIPHNAVEEALQRKVSQSANLPETRKIDPSITGAIPILTELEDKAAPRDVDAATQ